MRVGHLIFYVKTGMGHVLFSKNMRVGYIKLAFIKMIFFSPAPTPVPQMTVPDWPAIKILQRSITFLFRLR